MTAMEATMDTTPADEKSEGEKKEKRLAIPVPKVFKEMGDSVNEKFSEYNEKFFKQFAETGKAFACNVKEDVNKLMEELVEKGKKSAPKLAFPEKVEKKVSGKINAAANHLNIPSKGDVDRLARAVEALSEKVDALNAEKRN